MVLQKLTAEVSATVSMFCAVYGCNRGVRGTICCLPAVSRDKIPDIVASQKSYIRWKPIKGEKRQKDVRYNTTVNPFPKHRWPSASISLLQIRRVQHLLHLLRLGCLCSVSQPRARHHLKVDSSSRWLASISTWTCPSEGEEVRTQNTLL